MPRIWPPPEPGDHARGRHARSGGPDWLSVILLGLLLAVGALGTAVIVLAGRC